MKDINILTRAQMKDLLITALEGGSNYWYLLLNISTLREKYKKDESQLAVDFMFDAVINHGESIPVYDVEEVDGFESEEEIRSEAKPLGYISKENFARANKLFFEQHKSHFADLITENYDASTADIWFQLVVMGEITFG